MNTIPVNRIDSGSVVRLPDGRLGWLWHGRGRDPYRVVLESDGVQVSVRASDELEVVRWPAELAAEWIAGTAS